MSSAQVLKQAEALKASVSGNPLGGNEAWVSRQNLQDLYQKLLVMDLEYALDKKVEQDLWNHAFKNQINTLQSQAKDKQNPKRNEIQSSLSLFLETASGFYLQLLQELSSAFKLDLPFRQKSSNFGILREYGPLSPRMKTPNKSSSLYICQHCLVHLGDIARYRQQIDQAQTYYRHAAALVPYNGQPYNQLAILEAAKGNKLFTVFYYIRSIAVKHPFPVASTNLEKFYAKISKENLDFRGKLSMSEIVASFLQFHAFVHDCIEFDKAKHHAEKLISSLPTHITSMSFSSFQLLQMVAINLFAMHHAKRKLHSEDNEDVNEVLGSEEQKCYDLVFNMTVSLLDNMLHHTPKQEQKAKEYHTLPALKVLFDWLRSDKQLLAKPMFKNSTIWPNMSKLLNNLQFHANQKDLPFVPEDYTKHPLPEDCDLQCFLPMQKVYSSLDFSLQPSDVLPSDIEIRLRCHRILEHGIGISDEFPSLNLINYQGLKSGRLQFSAPTAQVKVLSGSDSESVVEKKSYRQNVAIQAIMQKNANKGGGEFGRSNPGDVTPARIQHKPEQEYDKSDASVMVTAKETQITIQQRDPNKKADFSAGQQPPPTRQPPPTPQQQDSGFYQIGQAIPQPGALFQSPVQSQMLGTSPYQYQDNMRGLGPRGQLMGQTMPDNFRDQGTRPHHFAPQAQSSYVEQNYFRNPLPVDLMKNMPNIPPHLAPNAEPPQSPPGHPGLKPSTMSQSIPFGYRQTSPIGISPSHSPGQSMIHSRNMPGLPQARSPVQEADPMQTMINPGSDNPLFDLLRGEEGNMHQRHENFDHDFNSEVDLPHLEGLEIKAPIGRELAESFQGSPYSAFGEKNPQNTESSLDGNTSHSSFYGYGNENASEIPANAATYSLFSQSPWSVKIPTAENKSLSSSPFDSSSSSVRTTPDLFSNTEGSDRHAAGIGGMNLAYSYGPVDGNWSQGANLDETTGSSGLMSSNIQSLWSSGPSPLERLLEQQKHQRQNEPH